MINYFEVEPILVKHITDNVEGLLAVDTPFDIDDMLDNSNTTPSVSVIYYGDRMGEISAKGALNVQYQQWLIVLKLTDPMAQGGNTNSLRELANPFILQILKCMQGFDPKLAKFKHFKRVDCPVNVGSSSGFGYFPFLFEIQMFV